MKISSATYNNFKHLKNLKLEFSTDDKKPITVVRASNESGKTKSLEGMMWAFYGSKESGVTNIHPLYEVGGIIKISVEVEFEVETLGARDANRDKNKQYRVIRSCDSELQKDKTKASQYRENHKIFELTPAGAKDLTERESNKLIDEILPSDLKDVYFTDGDKALTFISTGATRASKRKRVSDAIEALLSIDTLNATIRHLINIRKGYASNIEDSSIQEELKKIEDRIISSSEDRDESDSLIRKNKPEISNGEEHLKDIKRNIENCLRKGDKEKLVNDQRKLKKQKDNLEITLKKVIKDYASLFSSRDISRIFISKCGIKSKKLLSDLRAQDEIPKSNIPILKELLKQEKCFCDTDLSETSQQGKINRERIKKRISNSAESDKERDALTSLYYKTDNEEYNGIGEEFIKNYSETNRVLQNTETNIADVEDEYNKNEELIRSIDDTNLQELKQLETTMAENISKLKQEEAVATKNIEECQNRLSDLSREQARIQNRMKGHSVAEQKFNTADQLHILFESIIGKMKDQELKKVSSEMSRIFTEMIGSDPEMNEAAIIKEAQLTDDFDIEVIGPNRLRIDPDKDLNGASRRAITMAFVLALTKVSEVNAPYIVDTPFGMLSGPVKVSILKQLLTEGSQVILFLTHDEIESVVGGIKPIFDKHAYVYTITNPATYPNVIKNKPDFDTVKRCDCNHNEFCQICELKDYI